MNRSRFVPVLVAGGLVAAACNPFRSPLKQAPVVQVTTRDANVNARWHGTLASPSSLAGAVPTLTVVFATGAVVGNTLAPAVRGEELSRGFDFRCGDRPDLHRVSAAKLTAMERY